MDNQPINRVEMEMSGWRAREERFSKLFSLSLSSNKGLLKEKLQDFERIAAKYKGTPDPDERFALLVLKQERRQMEKQLYPNVLVRLLRRLFILPVREQILVSQNIRQAEQSSRSLHEQVQRAGFTGLSAVLDQQMGRGQEQFTVPISYYVNEKERLDHQLAFAKGPEGQYQFEGYKTSLYNDAKPEVNRQQYFDLKHGFEINKTEAYNLLAGRAIQKNEKWLQLDPNDKDARGNHRIKQFHADYGYDLQKLLQQLPLKELAEKMQADKLKDILRQGGRQSVTFLKDGKEQRYYIEANPQFKSVNIYDEHSRKISLATAVGNKTVEALKVVHKVKRRTGRSQVQAQQDACKPITSRM